MPPHVPPRRGGCYRTPLDIKYDPVNDSIDAFNIAIAISGCPWMSADCFRCSTCALTNVLPRLTLNLVHGIRNMDTTKLSSKGQVVLPKSVRDQHGWGEGTEFVVESTAHGVLLRPRQAFPATRIDGVFGSLPYRGKPKSLSDFDAGIRREIRRRHGRT